MGLTVDLPAQIQVKNTAAVMVTATLPPYGAGGVRASTSRWRRWEIRPAYKAESC